MGSVGVVGGHYVVNARAAIVETGQVVSTARVEIDFKTFNATASETISHFKAMSAIKSAVIPGWGQIANHQEVKGVLIMAASATLLGFGIRNTIVGYRYQQTYNAITKDNPGACVASVADSGLFNDCLHSQQGKVVRAYQVANMFYGGFALLYTYNIIDAYIFGNASAYHLTAPQGRTFNVGVAPTGLTFSGSF